MGEGTTGEGTTDGEYTGEGMTEGEYTGAGIGVLSRASYMMPEMETVAPEGTVRPTRWNYGMKNQTGE